MPYFCTPDTTRQPNGQCLVWLLAAGTVAAAVVGAEIHRIRWISTNVLPILHQLADRQREYARTAEYAIGWADGRRGRIPDQHYLYPVN